MYTGQWFEHRVLGFSPAEPWLCVVVGVAAAGLVLVLAEWRVHLVRQIAKKEMAALQASESMFRNALVNLPEGMLIQKPDGVIAFINSAALGLTTTLGNNVRAVPGELPINGFDDVIDEHGRSIGEEELPRGRVLATGEPVSGAIYGVRVGEAVQWLSCSAVAIDDGSPDGAIVISINDVTNERKLTAQLASEERRFRMALQHAPIGMAIASANGEFLQVNSALCSFVGRSESDLLTESFRDVLHPEELDVVTDNGHALLTGVFDSYRRESRWVTPWGEVRHGLTAVAVVRDDEQQDPYFIVQVADIRERKRSEEAQALALQLEREAVARLQELDRTKSDFVATVSHELRTPLASVIGYLELLGDDPEHQLTQSQARMVRSAARNSDRLLNLIEDLLLLSAIETRSMRLDITSFDVPEMIQRVVDELTPCAGLHASTLQATVSPDLTTLTGDVNRIEQVLVNLGTNAIKFTPNGGLIRIDAVPAKRPAGSSDSDVDWIEFRMSDNGVGMSEADQEQLFTRFFRSESARIQAIPGVGLGLTIVSGIVEAHGGEIQVDSQLGVGTTVTVRLPARVEAADAPVFAAHGPEAL